LSCRSGCGFWTLRTASRTAVREIKLGGAQRFETVTNCLARPPFTCQLSSDVHTVRMQCLPTYLPSSTHCSASLLADGRGRGRRGRCRESWTAANEPFLMACLTLTGESLWVGRRSTPFWNNHFLQVRATWSKRIPPFPVGCCFCSFKSRAANCVVHAKGSCHGSWFLVHAGFVFPARRI
jgi:hypothetical protein